MLLWFWAPCDATDINIIKDCETVDAVRKSNPQKNDPCSPTSPQRVVGSNSMWGSDFFCVLLWFILYISLYFLYNIFLF